MSFFENKDLNEIFMMGVRVGLERAQRLHELEMQSFFQKAGLVNPFTKQNISTMKDFDAWYTEQQARKKNTQQTAEVNDAAKIKSPNEMINSSCLYQPAVDFAKKVGPVLFKDKISIQVQDQLTGACLGWARVVLNADSRRIHDIINHYIDVEADRTMKTSDLSFEKIEEPMRKAIVGAFTEIEHRLPNAYKEEQYAAFCDLLEMILHIRIDDVGFEAVVKELNEFSFQYRKYEDIPVPAKKDRGGTRGNHYLVEAEDGTLVGVWEDRLDDWMDAQGKAVSDEYKKAEERVLERALDMLYGKN